MIACCFGTSSGRSNGGTGVGSPIENGNSDPAARVSSTEAAEDAFGEVYPKTIGMKYEKMEGKTYNQSTPLIKRKSFSSSDLSVHVNGYFEENQSNTSYGSLPIEFSGFISNHKKKTVLEDESPKKICSSLSDPDELFQFDGDENIIESRPMEVKELFSVNTEQNPEEGVLSEAEQKTLNLLFQQCHAKVDKAENEHEVLSIQKFWSKAFPGLKYLKMDTPTLKTKHFYDIQTLNNYNYKTK